MLPWKGILIHHSLTEDSGTVSWDAIRRFHMDPNGPAQYRMRDIGYHAGIELIDGKYEVLFGRPLDWIGAHCPDVNRTHLGFLFVGNYDVITPTREMLRTACSRVIRPWMKAFDIKPSEIQAHREYAPKTCPGKLFDMGILKMILASLPPADFEPGS